MKKKIRAIQEEKHGDRKVTRREALKKAGMISLTTATMMVLLKSPAMAANSVPDKMPVQGRPRPSRPYPDDNK